MKKTLPTIAMLSLAITLPVSGAIIFAEDFESYASGSNLRGQGGWVEAGITADPMSVITVAPGRFLGSQVINGRTATGLFQENLVDHPVVLDPASISTLRFTAYASSEAPPTRNQVVGLGNLGHAIDCSGLGPPGATCYVAYWGPEFNGSGPRWLFTVAGVSGLFVVPGGYDRPVDLRIVVDGPRSKIYGQYDIGSGIQDTPHYTLPPGYIDKLNAIHLYWDRRGPSGFSGMEVDNIRVTSTPILSIRHSEVEVCWGSVSNQMYQVQYRSDLTTNMWVSLGGPVSGNGSTNCIRDTITLGQPRRFYQLVELP